MDGGSSRTHEAISFGPFCLIPAERQLKKGDERLQLGSRALDTLVVLAERAGEVVAQRDLISRVWPDVTVDEANLRIPACSVASDGGIDEGIVAEAIAGLLAKSLLSTTALHGLTYYRLLETTRIFAQTKLAQPGEANRVAARRAEYYKPSIAVLAFNNMSGDPEQEYFSDGISENIITDLSTCRNCA